MRPPHALLRWLLVWLVCLAAPALAGEDVLQHEVLKLDQAWFTLSASTSPPSDGGVAIRLPDVWMEQRPRAARAAPATGWYRMTFAAPRDVRPLAVYLPRLGLNAEVFVNGVAIGAGGAFHEPVGRNWNRPLLFVIPAPLLRAQNRLDVRLLSHPYTQANLDPVYVGPERVLRERYESRLFWRVSLNQTATLSIAAMGALMLTLWWLRRQEVAYLWFGLSSLIWAAQSANLYLRSAPLPTAAWEMLINASFQVFSALLLAALLRFSNAGSGPLIPWLWGSALAAPLVLAAAPAPWFMPISSALHAVTLVFASLTLVLLMRAAVRWRNRDAAILVAAMGLVVVLGAHDFLKHAQTGLFPDDEHLLHYSAPFVFFMVGLVMTSRFVTVLNQFETLNNDLEARFQAKQAQLRESYERMHALETDRAIAEERERIYRDLHDDVGAKLLSLVYRANTPENASLARSALQDLRDVVSIIQPENLTLDALSADWRAECERRLADAGIELDWTTAGELEQQSLTQPQALSLGRILREAVSNLIKHAQASRANVRLTLAAEGLTLFIADNGVGCDDSAAHDTGSGVRNMAMRAERIGAGLRRDKAATGGCEIEVFLPEARLPQR